MGSLASWSLGLGPRPTEPGEPLGWGCWIWECWVHRNPHLPVLPGAPSNIFTCPQGSPLPRCQDQPNQLCQSGIPVTAPPSLPWLQEDLGPARGRGQGVGGWEAGSGRRTGCPNCCLILLTARLPDLSCSLLLLPSSSRLGPGAGLHFLLGMALPLWPSVPQNLLHQHLSCPSCSCIPFIHSGTPTERLFWAKRCARPWEYSGEPKLRTRFGELSNDPTPR